jgi:hypothetical protein
VSVKLRRHRFASPVFSVVDSFVDFVGNKVTPAQKSISRTMLYFEEAFYKTVLWQKSPYIYVAGHGMVAAPSTEDEVTDANRPKDDAWLMGTLLPLLHGNNSSPYLSMSEVWKAFHQFGLEIGAVPYQGDGLQSTQSKAIAEKYVLVTQDAVWNAFQGDPWLLENRPVNLNIITDGFMGDLFGKVLTRIESFGMRFLYDSLDNPTTVALPAPEMFDDDTNTMLTNRVKPNPDYATNSQVWVSWLVGYNPADRVAVGGMPGPWNRDNGKGQPGDWNGKIYTNDNLLIECDDGSGNTVVDTNSWGEYLRLQSQATYGLLPGEITNIFPIVHKRPLLGLPTIG